MASTRHPEERYRGVIGATSRAIVHVACPCGAHHAAEVVESIDASADPALARRAVSSEPMNRVTCSVSGEASPIERPLIFHDPGRAILALVLPPSFRAREIDERIALYGALAADPAPIAGYAVEFDVVYGGDGLARLLSARGARGAEDGDGRDADAASEAGRVRLERATLERERAAFGRERATFERDRQVTARERADFDRRRGELEDRFREHDRRGAQLAAAEVEVARREAEAGRREADLARRDVEAARQRAALARRIAERPPSDGGTDPFLFGVVSTFEEIQAVAPAAAPPQGATPDPDGATRVAPRSDSAVEKWIAMRESLLKRLDGDEPRIYLCGNTAELESLVTGPLTVRVGLHRMPSYPLLVVELCGSAGATPTRIPFDVQSELDRAILGALSRRFRFGLELYDHDYLVVGQRAIEAPLGDNLRYAQSAALEHLKRVPPGERSHARALVAFAAAGEAAGAVRAPEELAALAALDDLAGAATVRSALAALGRLSEPASEERILLAGGVPLADWHRRRRAVLERACELGLWTGPNLAQLAVSEGLARSRKELIIRLRRQFTHLLAGRNHGLDDDAVALNWQALRGEARVLGLTTEELVVPRAEPIVSAAGPTASGTFGVATGPSRRANGRRVDLDGLAAPRLIELLAEPVNRLPAAIELCRRGDASTIAPVFAVLEDMSRGEAGRLLGAAVGFGRAAVPGLIARLGARKGYVRQGVALALAVLRDEDATEALCDLVLVEPTEIWREIARAVGEVGGAAVLPLAARVAGAEDERHERIAWAMAHVVARGARRPVETLAGGNSGRAAQVARRALELAELAQRDNLVVRSDQREQTVNRAFSRRFFEALAAPAVQVGADGAVDLSAPAMLLDDADLLESRALDSESELDDGDLLPP